MKRVSLAIFLFLAFCNLRVNAQYKLEIGGLLGVSSYQGDALPHSPFASLNNFNSAMLRYNFNNRYSLKLDIGQGKLSGNIANSDVVLPLTNVEIENQEIQFSKDISEVSLQLEYNFFPYTTESIVNASRFSPYVFAGIGTTIDKSRSSIHIPFGLGVKYRLAQRLNIGLEVGYRKLFTDDLDTTDGSNKNLDNPLELNESNWINNDWYTVSGIFITYSFGDTEWNCNLAY